MTIFFESTALNLMAVFAAFFIGLYLYFTRNFNFWKKLGIPYVKPVPFLGSMTDVMLQKIDMSSNLKNLYDANKDKPYVGILAFDKPALVVNDLDLVKKILVQDCKCFIDHVIDVHQDVDPLIGRIIFVLKGRKWEHMRQKMSSAFVPGKMKMLFYLVENCSKELVRYLDKESSGGSLVMVRETLARYTTDIISTCAFGIESNSLKNPDAEVRQQMRQVFKYTLRKGIAGMLMFFAPELQNFFRLNFVENKTARFFRSMILSAVDYRQKHDVARSDLLESLMELRKKSLEGNEPVLNMDDEMLIAQAFQIFIAGFETSSSTATFALYQLAFHPEIQERLREEMLDNLTKHNQEVTYDGIKEMTYLHMVISETLRMYPVIAFLDRVCQQDYQLPDPLREGSVTLPARTSVYIPLLGIHRNPEYYPDPEKFDPERFTEEGKQLRPKYSYLPFGDGPRNCLGKLFGLLQVKTALIHILSKYVVTPCKDTPRNLVYDQKSFVLQTRDDIPLVFKRFGH